MLEALHHSKRHIKIRHLGLCFASIGVRDEFVGGGGAEVSCPNNVSIAYPKIKWFCPKIAISKNSRILGGATHPLSPAPYTYVCTTDAI